MAEFERDTIKQHAVRDFIITGAFMMATAAAFGQKSAQASLTSENDSVPDKDKTTLTYEVNGAVNNLSALALDEKTATFYNNITPSLNASIEDGKGDKASFSVLELLIYDAENKNIKPILSTFMAELDKKLPNGGELFLKAGRENTQGGDIFPNAISYFAEDDIVPFGNGSERMVLGYQHNGSFVELGTIQNKGEGKYILWPNMNEADFWGKGHLSLLSRGGVHINLETAARLGEHRQLGIVSLGMTTPGGFGAKALFERDFKENDNKALVRIYENLKNGSKVIGELVHAGEGKGLDLRLGYGAKGLQVFAQYNTKDKKPMVGLSYSTGVKKTISKSRHQR